MISLCSCLVSRVIHFCSYSRGFKKHSSTYLCFWHGCSAVIQLISSVPNQASEENETFYQFPRDWYSG